MSELPSQRAVEAGIARVRLLRARGAELSEGDDEIAVEEPLEIRVGGEPFATTMRTPGSDHELVAGFLYAEGVLLRHADVSGIAHCGRFDEPGYGNTIEVTLTAGAPPVAPEARRLNTVSSACGVCGAASIEQLAARLTPLPAAPPFSATWLGALPSALRQAQPNFARTGGLHAAGLVHPDRGLQLVREDIGRHNAVDKVVGRLFLDQALPAAGSVLVVTGRAGFEIVHKAVAAGICGLVSVSAPSSLAIETATRFGLLLVGFARDGGFNVYAGRTRLADSP